MNSIPNGQSLQKIANEDPEIGAAIVASDGRWLEVNPYLCEMLGYTELELLQMKFQDITHPEDLAEEQPYLQRLVAGDIDHYRFKKRYLTRHGHIVWGLLDRSVARDPSGKPAYFISRIRNVTSEVAAEKAGTSFLSSLGKRIRQTFRMS